MQIESSVNGREAVLTLTGRLNARTAPGLEELLESLPDEVQTLTLDLGGLHYLAAAGLRVIEAARRRLAAQNGSVALKNVAPEVEETLELTGFSTILPIV